MKKKTALYSLPITVAAIAAKVALLCFLAGCAVDRNATSDLLPSTGGAHDSIAPADDDHHGSASATPSRHADVINATKPVQEAEKSLGPVELTSKMVPAAHEPTEADLEAFARSASVVAKNIAAASVASATSMPTVLGTVPTVAASVALPNQVSYSFTITRIALPELVPTGGDFVKRLASDHQIDLALASTDPSRVPVAVWTPRSDAERQSGFVETAFKADSSFQSNVQVTGRVSGPLGSEIPFSMERVTTYLKSVHVNIDQGVIKTDNAYDQVPLGFDALLSADATADQRLTLRYSLNYAALMDGALIPNSNAASKTSVPVDLSVTVKGTQALIKDQVLVVPLFFDNVNPVTKTRDVYLFVIAPELKA